MMNKHNIHFESELSAWKYYLRQSVRVYTKNGMLRVGKRSWWSRVKQQIPENFAGEYGHIREPWLTNVALWMRRYGLKASEDLNIAVDNVVPLAISTILGTPSPECRLHTGIGTSVSRNHRSYNR